MKLPPSAPTYTTEFVERAGSIVQIATDLSKTVASWAEFQNAVFSQNEGVIARTLQNEVERKWFYNSEWFNYLSALRQEVMERTGLVEGATPKEKSGKFLVRIPRSLHAELEAEATREGVSLNQLAVAKLSQPIRSHASKPDEWLRRVLDTEEGEALLAEERFLRRVGELVLRAVRGD